MLHKVFGEFFTFLDSFRSPQGKQNEKVIMRDRMYELPHELPNNLRLRILGT